MAMSHKQFGVPNLAGNDFQKEALEEAVRAFEQYEMIVAKINSYKQIMAHYWNEYDETGNNDFLRTHYTFKTIVEAFDHDPNATESLGEAWKYTSPEIYKEFTNYLASL